MFQKLVAMLCGLMFFVFLFLPLPSYAQERTGQENKQRAVKVTLGKPVALSKTKHFIFIVRYVDVVPYIIGLDWESVKFRYYGQGKFIIQDKNYKIGNVGSLLLFREHLFGIEFK